MKQRQAIEALRAGVPNRNAIRLLGTREDAIRNRFLESLRTCRSEAVGHRQASGMVISGGFGSGKSHLLGYFQELALEEGFVVSLVSVSKETPLFDPVRLFAAAVRNATVPDRNDDVMTAAVQRALERTDAFADLEAWATTSASGLAQLFPALLHLLPRQAVTPDNVNTIARFFAGSKLAVSSVKQWLRTDGSAKLFDVRTVKQAELAEQRLRFAPRLFAAAGYAGWCILLDEVELIGRYGPVQRGRSYAELSRWLGRTASSPLPGIVTVAAISDDFASVVIHDRQDEERIPPRLEARGWDGLAEQARQGMRILDREAHGLRRPDETQLNATLEAVRSLYGAAYRCDPASLDAGDRVATRTMRQYIKSWITTWDLERLYHERGEIEEEGIGVNYEETSDLEQAAPAEADAEQ